MEALTSFAASAPAVTTVPSGLRTRTEADLDLLARGVVANDEFTQLPDARVALHADAFIEIEFGGAVVFKFGGGEILFDDEWLLWKITDAQFSTRPPKLRRSSRCAARRRRVLRSQPPEGKNKRPSAGQTRIIDAPC